MGDKLHAICQKTYKEQAVWFLNAFWEDFGEKEAETLSNYVNVNSELDLENHGEGVALDEMKAHVFLEKFNETLTVREMRAKLRSTGAIGESERPKTVPLTHFLLYKYNVNWHTLVDETLQGSNKEEMEKAEKMLEEVAAAVKESEAKASAARKALAEAQNAESAAKSREAEAVDSENKAKQREAEAKASEEQAKQREADAKKFAEDAKAKEAQAQKDAVSAKEREREAIAAKQELEAALKELEAEEKAFNDKKETLKRKSEEGGVVSRNKAANELAQLMSEDPLPLRRAKITQEAAVKKAERTAKASAEATAAAEASAQSASKARADAEASAEQASVARKNAEEAAAAASRAREAASQAKEAAAQAREAATAAAKASENAKNEAEAALDEARKRFKEAEDYLEEVKSKPGQAFGQLWWLDRELHEQRKYLPESKGGIRK